ncbi:MAG: NAD+ synthase [Acidobacteriota bacterium]
MRIALAQANPTVADLPGNRERLTALARRAAEGGARLAVFPELALVGYPPQDLLDEPGFVRHAIDEEERWVEELGKVVPGLTVIYGSLTLNPNPEAKPLQNTVALARDGAVLARRVKTLLPSYDVFDEDRWFARATDNTPVEHDGHRLGLTVCEDAWNDVEYHSRPLYSHDPVAALAETGASLLVNVSASPHHRGKPAEREAMFGAAARRHGLPLLFVNQVGGQDELTFDGHSAVFDAQGRVVARAAGFEEDLLLAELPDDDTPALPELPSGDIKELRSALTLGLSDYLRKCGFSDVVLGLSGGIDSAVVAALAADALGPDRVTGVMMPSRYSSDGSVDHSVDLAERLGIETLKIPIEPAHSGLLSMLDAVLPEEVRSITEENLQARIRGTLLMALSNQRGWLVLSTGNKSELALGYCTLYGDMNGGLSVLGDCYKGWVRELAELYHERGQMPRSIIDKPPSAELRPDQVDTDSLPPYDLVDTVLTKLIEGRGTVDDVAAAGHSRETAVSLRRRLDGNEYKRRQAPPVLRVSTRAFGPGRRLPLARGPWPPRD